MRGSQMVQAMNGVHHTCMGCAAEYTARAMHAPSIIQPTMHPCMHAPCATQPAMHLCIYECMHQASSSPPCIYACMRHAPPSPPCIYACICHAPMRHPAQHASMHAWAMRYLTCRTCASVGRLRRCCSSIGRATHPAASMAPGGGLWRNTSARGRGGRGQCVEGHGGV